MNTFRSLTPWALLMTLLVFGKGQLAATQTPAAAGHPLYIEQLDECSYMVRVSNPQQVAAHLQLVDATGAVLYAKSSKNPSFGEKLNLSHLADGRYAVVVKMGRNTQRFALDIRTTQTRSAQLISLATR